MKRPGRLPVREVLRNGNQAMSENAVHKIELGELEERIRSSFGRTTGSMLDHFSTQSFRRAGNTGEIADLLGISVKTMEAQMSKALKKLREELINFNSINRIYGNG